MACHTNDVLYGTMEVLITQINVWLTLHSVKYDTTFLTVIHGDINCRAEAIILNLSIILLNNSHNIVRYAHRFYLAIMLNFYGTTNIFSYSLLTLNIQYLSDK